MATALFYPSPLQCSDCNSFIPSSHTHYHIFFDIRHLIAQSIEIDHSESTATLCVKCSLKYDLSQLIVPVRLNGYWSPAREDNGSRGLRCSDCGGDFSDGKPYQHVMIQPYRQGTEDGEPLTEIAFCENCREPYLVEGTEPPRLLPTTVECQLCGDSVPFDATYAHPWPETKYDMQSWPDLLKPGEAFFCSECFHMEFVVGEGVESNRGRSDDEAL